MPKAFRKHGTADKTLSQLNKDELLGLAEVLDHEIEDDIDLKTLRTRLKPIVIEHQNSGFICDQFAAVFRPSRRSNRSAVPLVGDSDDEEDERRKHTSSRLRKADNSALVRAIRNKQASKRQRSVSSVPVAAQRTEHRKFFYIFI
jgi:hypothetical protein